MARRQRQPAEDLPIRDCEGNLIDLPCRYRQQRHPTVPSDFSCTKCRFGLKQESKNDRDQQNNVTVCGAGPDDLSKIRLIVVSDYPGAYESDPQRGYPMVDNRIRPRESDIPARLNAGGVIRWALSEMFGLDTYTDCWFTNAMRCNPNQNKPLEVDLKACANAWGKTEIDILDQYVPTAPILIAGSLAFRSLKYLFPLDWKHVSSIGQNECRRRNDIRLGKHPLVVTMNPAVAARADMVTELTLRPDSRTGFTVAAGELVRPFMIGSPMWHLGRDLSYLEDFI